MKKVSLYVCFLFSFLFCLNRVNAFSTASTGIYQLKIRDLPTTSSLEKGLIPAATSITLLEDTLQTGNGCDDNWFKIEYNNITGYACSTYLNTIVWEEDNNEEDETTDSSENTTDNPEVLPEEDTTIDIESVYLEELEKFPESYKTKIEKLHEVYPNAVFKALNVDTSFNSFATYQYQGYKKGSLVGCGFGKEIGMSLLEDTTSSRDGLKSLDSWAYTPLTDTFNTSYYGGEQGRWYAPSLKTVKYYVDPRNFLTNVGIFMFEKQGYAGDYYLESDIEIMLKGTFMYKTNVTVPAGKESVTFAKAFIDAGKSSGISPYSLVSRVIQEIGPTRGAMVSGKWSGYDNAYYGYYNFYNIKAAGNTVEETIKNGLNHAKNAGWNNEYDAIVGGASLISNNYIADGQDTAYLQKFDVYGPCYGFQQYMQNIEAPMSEAYKTYNAYNLIGLFDSNFVFVIPVYEDMPESTSLDDPRNKNNYLRDLTVNGTTIEGFDYQKEEYTINVSNLVNSVEIAATKSSSKSEVIGTGSFELTEEEQTKEIVVTAENGDVRTYKITVTKDIEQPISVSEILNTMLINSDGTYISSIQLNTTASNFIEKAKEVDSNANVVIKNANGEEKTDAILVTGDEVTITSGEETKTFKVVIYGDLNGDGIINSGDLFKLRQHLINPDTLKDEFTIAANITKTDDIINSGDLFKLRQHLISPVIEQ